MLEATQDAAVVRRLEVLEEQPALTWKNHDRAGWSAPLADDWSVTRIDAQVITKDQALEMRRAGPPIHGIVRARRSIG